MAAVIIKKHLQKSKKINTEEEVDLDVNMLPPPDQRCMLISSTAESRSCCSSAPGRTDALSPPLPSLAQLPYCLFLTLFRPPFACSVACFLVSFRDSGSRKVRWKRKSSVQAAFYGSIDWPSSVPIGCHLPRSRSSRLPLRSAWTTFLLKKSKAWKSRRSWWPQMSIRRRYVRARYG